MRDRRGRPVPFFRVPPGSPKPVADAHATYRELAEELRHAESNHRRAIAHAEAAHERELEEYAEAKVAGEEPPAELGTSAREARADSEAAAEDLERARAAVDRAGDALLAAVDDAREEWIEANAKRTQRIRGRYDEILGDVRQLLGELAQCWQVRDWLTGEGPFAPNRGRAERHSYRPPAGDRVRIHPDLRPVPIDQVVKALESVYPTDRGEEPKR